MSVGLRTYCEIQSREFKSPGTHVKARVGCLPLTSALHWWAETSKFYKLTALAEKVSLGFRERPCLKIRWRAIGEDSSHLPLASVWTHTGPCTHNIHYYHQHHYTKKEKWLDEGKKGRQGEHVVIIIPLAESFFFLKSVNKQWTRSFLSNNKDMEKLTPIIPLKIFLPLSAWNVLYNCLIIWEECAY